VRPEGLGKFKNSSHRVEVLNYELENARGEAFVA
jgi:hypothetical protein